MPAKTEPRVVESPGSRPLLMMYKSAEAAKPSFWTQLESRFLAAMWDFDQGFSIGRTNLVDNQNGKRNLFGDLITLILENCSGKELHGRGRMPGLIFPHHNLDTSYPKEGAVEILIETKVAGAPKTSRNPQQRNPKGRPGSSDLDKRVKEAGLKAMDLKAAWARNASWRKEPTSDLLTWLHESKPQCYLLLAIRVVDTRDLKRTIASAEAADRMMDGVGVVAYEPNPSGDGYRVCRVPPHLELDRVLSRVCSALRILP